MTNERVYITEACELEFGGTQGYEPPVPAACRPAPSAVALHAAVFLSTSYLRLFLRTHTRWGAVRLPSLKFAHPAAQSAK
jgi:hypothetical protein